VIGFDKDKRAEVRRHTSRCTPRGDPEKGVAAFMAFAEFGAKEVYARSRSADDFLTKLANATIEGGRCRHPSSARR